MSFVLYRGNIGQVLGIKYFRSKSVKTTVISGQFPALVDFCKYDKKNENNRLYAPAVYPHFQKLCDLFILHFTIWLRNHALLFYHLGIHASGD